MSQASATVLMGASDIALRVPHRGAMCWLDGLLACSDTDIVCTASNHRDPTHPLRTASGLLASAAIEYAAQAMALHGALRADAQRAAPQPGFLASARAVQFHTWRLDELPGPLTIRASCQAGDDRQLLYTFALTDGAGAPVAQGRAAVVLNTPLRPPESTMP
jgi:predicted hotdog family 3-hydroxylacyl-ACP dehydratase